MRKQRPERRPRISRRRRDRFAVWYGNGAPERIRTSDPQIRSLSDSTENKRKFCKPALIRPKSNQSVTDDLQNENRTAAAWWIGSSPGDFLRQIFAPAEFTQANYGSPIADKHLALIETLIDGGDIVIVQGRDRKYAIIPEENLPALGAPETDIKTCNPTPSNGDINRAYVKTWEALNWLRFWLTRMPERLRESERRVKAGKAPDLDLISELGIELKERASDALHRISELSRAAAAVNKTKINGRKEAA